MTATVQQQPACSIDDLPQPPAHRIWGNAPAFQRDVLGSLLDGLAYGDVVRYQFGPSRGPLGRSAVAVHHPAGVQQVLTQSERHFGKGAVGFDVLAEMLGRGLLTTEGEVWKRQRRTLQPLFTPRRVAGYADLMAGEAERLMTSVPSGPTDLHLLMLRYTLRVVGKALFGSDVDRAVPAMHRLVPLATDLVRERTFQMARLPLRWPTPRNRRFVGTRRELYGLVDDILAVREAAASGDQDDLVTRLFAARDPQSGAPLSHQEVRDQLLVFLLAGHETTAGALTFTLHLLGRHPQEQDAVAAEVAEVLGRRAVPSGDDVARLVRTRAALMEGMRLFPPAYITERVATTETELAGYALPAGILIFASPWVTHRHPAYWPDPERFDPSRFYPSVPGSSVPGSSRPDPSGPDRSGPIRSGPNRSGPNRSGPNPSRPDRSGPGSSRPDPSRRDPIPGYPAGLDRAGADGSPAAAGDASGERPRYAYFPFGGGPRACIGEHFAMLEATILLATLLGRYRVIAETGDISLRPQVTLRPAHPVLVRLEPRAMR